MKKNYFLRLLLCCITVVLMISSNSYGAEYPIFFGDGPVVYEKYFDETDSGKGVTISVTDVDDVWDDTEWENEATDIFVYADNGTIDQNGKCTFEFTVDDSGIYNAVLGVDGAFENIYDKFEVIINEQAKAASERIKGASTVTEVETIIRECKKELSLNSENFDLLSGKVAEIILNSKDLVTMEPSNDIILAKKALKVAEFNVGKVVSINDIKDVVGIKDSDFEKWYKDSFEKQVISRLTNKRFKDIASFDKAVKEAVLLERIENPSGNADIVNIISENHQDMNLKYSSVSLSIAGKLAGGNYATYKELNEKISELKKSASNNDSSGNGGGGSSGGGKGGSFGGGSSNVGVFEVEKNITTVKTQKPTSRFSDMLGFDWAESAVETIATRGIVNGKGNGEFAPGDYVTREEFAKMIVSLFNFNVVSTDFEFEDVNKDSWYYEYVKRAYGSKVVNGVSENLFGSGQNILRQDAIVMTYNALKYIDSAGKGETVKHFDDADNVSEYAWEAVDVLSSLGIIKGDDMGRLLPKANITRAEAAMIIYNVMNRFSL